VRKSHAARKPGANRDIEKPNQGERIESDSDAMKALEAYMYWSNKGSALDPGRH
jgi:thiosulfate dehydrogenase